MTDDKGVVVSRKGALETCGQPADKQASKESGEPHLTSSERGVKLALSVTELVG